MQTGKQRNNKKGEKRNIKKRKDFASISFVSKEYGPTLKTRRHKNIRLYHVFFLLIIANYHSDANHGTIELTNTRTKR